MSIISLAAHSVATLYLAGILLLSLFGLHRLWILGLYYRYRRSGKKPACQGCKPLPRVTIQLPLFNEKYVVERLIQAACSIHYPASLLEIQVLDDSTDETQALARAQVESWKAKGQDIVYLHRLNRAGFKAGALAYGLETAKGELLAVFDADFLPPPDFLNTTVPYFNDADVGMVQTRWGHLNSGYSLLTKLQAVFLDGHFFLEHTARNRSGSFFNFNGTAGIWRRSAIESAGGWQSDTLTEDLDISYRAQLAGWRFVFLPDLVCPAELPADIHAYKTQQHRWTAGAFQTARKILPSIWRSGFPLRVKTEATFHLTGGVCYALMALISLVLPIQMILRSTHRELWSGSVEGPLLLATLFSTLLFYVISLRRLHSDWFPRILHIPLMISFGAGMCWNNARAVFDGLFDRTREFHRTAKYAIPQGSRGLAPKSYRAQRAGPAMMEWLCSAYFLLALWIAWHLRAWSTMPFLAMFFAGNLYVACLNRAHAFPRSIR